MAREWITKGIASIKNAFTPKKIPEQLKNRLNELGLKAKRKGNTVTFRLPENYAVLHNKHGIPSIQKAGIVTYTKLTSKGPEELAKLNVGLFSEESVIRLLNVHKNITEHLKLLGAIEKKEKG